MGRVVILEGPDGSGKTTLAKSLVTTGFEYKHEGPPEKDVDMIAHYLRILNESIESPNDVVLDRFWLGERIYGPICRGVDKVGPEGQKLFERLCRSKSVQQFICLPTIDVARANYVEKMKEKDDYLKSMETWERTYKAYALWMYSYGKLGMIYDYSKNDPWHVKAGIFSDECLIGNLPKGTIGSSTARHLFIGDQPNHPSIDVPFFAISGSSGYLNKALELAGISEKNLAISNAKSATGQFHTLGPILASLPDLQNIFLMGNIAKDWFYRQFRANEVTRVYRMHSLPHPSYLKRFKGHNPEVMAQMILEKVDGPTC